MPSFMENLNISLQVFKHSLRSVKAFMKFTKSLQVPGNFPLDHRMDSKKRVLRFTSVMENTYEASLTVEAALSLSLFLMMSAALLRPVLWLDRQRKLQTVTEQFCMELSQYGYVTGLMDRGKEVPEDWGGMDSEEGMEKNEYSWLSGMGNAAAGLWLRGEASAILEGTGNIRVSKAEVPDENGNIFLELEYLERIPFFSAAGGGVTMRTAAMRRIWNGTDGKLKSGKGESSQEKIEDTIMVYVGAGMGRYHWFRDCHYIYNEYTAIQAENVEITTNSSGRHYRPCERCCKGTVRGIVYVTQSGECYHADMSCSAMISYVREVPLKEVEYLGECSYCSRRK